MAPSGEVPRAFGVEASIDACHITFSGENPLEREHAIDVGGDECVTLDSHHCQRIVPNPESAAGPADTRQAAPAVHVRGRPVPSAAPLAALMATSTQRAELWETTRFRSLQAAFLRAGVYLPPISAPTTSETPPAECSLNIPLKTAMSKYVRRVRPSLLEFVELVHCQIPDDYRPNKTLVLRLYSTSARATNISTASSRSPPKASAFGSQAPPAAESIPSEPSFRSCSNQRPA